jgi:hypothetical protein
MRSDPAAMPNPKPKVTKSLHFPIRQRYREGTPTPTSQYLSRIKTSVITHNSSTVLHTYMNPQSLPLATYSFANLYTCAATSGFPRASTGGYRARSSKSSSGIVDRMYLQVTKTVSIVRCSRARPTNSLLRSVVARLKVPCLEGAEPQSVPADSALALRLQGLFVYGG